MAANVEREIAEPDQNLGFSSRMTLAQEISAALAFMVFSPPVIAFMVFGRWSRDNVELTFPALVYLLPLLLVALGIRLWFHMKLLAAAVYILGTAGAVAIAISSFGGELHAPIFGWV